MQNRADKRKYHYIYKTTCLITNKFYVGMHSTDNLEDGYLGSGKILRYSLKKHGAENHKREILELLPSREALKLREAELVNDSLLSNSLCMNLKYGGEGGGFLAEKNKTNDFHQKGYKAMMANRDHSAAAKKLWKNHREKMIAAIANNRDVTIGNTAMNTPEAIAKKKETFERIGHQQGENNSQYGTCWIIKNQKPIKIKKDELNEYLQQGFQMGRKIKI